MTTIEAAERLGIAESTVRQQIRAGRLKGRKIGRDWFVSVREVDRYRRESLGRPGRREGPKGEVK